MNPKQIRELREALRVQYDSMIKKIFKMSKETDDYLETLQKIAEKSEEIK